MVPQTPLVQVAMMHRLGGAGQSAVVLQPPLPLPPVPPVPDELLTGLVAPIAQWEPAPAARSPTTIGHGRQPRLVECVGSGSSRP
jgi:hypothetical protein